jgi:hypothetical protein
VRVLEGTDVHRYFPKVAPKTEPVIREQYLNSSGRTSAIMSTNFRVGLSVRTTPCSLFLAGSKWQETDAGASAQVGMLRTLDL